MNRELVFNILCIVLAFSLESCGVDISSEIKPNINCEHDEGWIDPRIHKVSPDAEFNTIFLGNNYYSANNTKLSQKYLNVYINDLRKVSIDPRYGRANIFLKSDINFPCNRYKDFAAQLDRIYNCTSSRICIWGYGIGENVWISEVRK
jgi:hypothetical protein